MTFLKEFRQTLLADANGGYDGVVVGSDITRAGCWAHAPRKFVDAQKTHSAIAAEAVGIIRQLYGVEEQAKNMSNEERLCLRQSQSQPILSRLRERLWAWKESFPFGMSRSFFGGRMSFKQKWGMRLTTPAERMFHLQIRRAGEGGKSFLINNPFITVEKDGLVAVVFSEAKTGDAEVAALSRQYLLPGIRRIRVFAFSNGYPIELTQ